MDAHRIVYDPVSWIHPQRFVAPPQAASVRIRSVVNDLLLRHYNLACGEIALTHHKEKYLVDNWRYLARGAFMAACHRYRASLTYSGKLAKLDKISLAFALTALSPSRDTLRGAISTEDIWHYACCELMRFAEGASVLLTGRLPLLFPLSVKTDVKDLAVDENNNLLIRMAIQYARKNQQS